MQQNTRIVPIVIVGVIVIIIALIISFMIDAKGTNAPISNYAGQAQPVSDTPSVASTSLNTITSSSNVNSDMNAYIQSANSAPNPNDFNDSYSDLNQ